MEKRLIEFLIFELYNRLTFMTPVNKGFLSDRLTNRYCADSNKICFFLPSKK